MAEQEITTPRACLEATGSLLACVPISLVYAAISADGIVLRQIASVKQAHVPELLEALGKIVAELRSFYLEQQPCESADATNSGAAIIPFKRSIVTAKSGGAHHD